MSDKSAPSFSVGRRWAIFFSVIVSMVAIAALVGMVNYLGARYSIRVNLSTMGKTELSPVTRNMLKSITNEVKVTIYYDRDEQLYSFVTGELDEFRQANPQIAVRSVDCNRDATEAIKVAAAYGLGAEARNLVIFQCGTNVQFVNDKVLADVDYAAVPNETQPEYERRIKGFKGEEKFAEALMRVTHPKPMMACFLTGHGEHDLTGEKYGYSRFKQELGRYNIQITTNMLDGTNAMPADCSLLIIAGPLAPIPGPELDKIRQFLGRGGHLFVMFRYHAAFQRVATGLEGLLAEWGLRVGMNWFKDPDNSDKDEVLAIGSFNPTHPVVKPLIKKYKLGLLVPRSIQKIGPGQQIPEGLKVDELAFTGPAVLVNDRDIPEKGPFPVMAAVEKANAQGVFSDHGTTRILAVGDSFFLSNLGIGIEENASFAALAAHWLIDQRQLPEEIAPRKVIDYSVRMTRAQFRAVSWIFLGAMPGGVLLLGGLVWLSRRR